MPRSEGDIKQENNHVNANRIKRKKKDKYQLSIFSVMKKLVPVDPTRIIIRAALGTILVFIVLMAHELTGVVGIVFVCILFAIGVSVP